MIKTIEDARATGYGSPAFKTQYREGFCIESVFHSYRSTQCTRKIWKDGFCKQHHPETVKAKNEKRKRRWKFKMENNPFTALAKERDSYRAKAEGLMGLISVAKCPNCDGSGFTIIETGGCDMDGENDTRGCEQVQCQWCFEKNLLMEDK